MSSRSTPRRPRAVPGTAVAAAAVWLLFGLAHLLGLRDWVSVLSGTPVAGVDWELAAVGGAVYVVAWFGAVLVAPILAVAAALTTAFGRPSTPGDTPR